MDTMPRPRPAVVVESADRRRGDRHRLDIPATLTPTAGGGPDVPAVVVAYSVNGVGLRVGQSLDVGATFAVSSYDTLIPPGLTVRVKSYRAHPEGDHEIGAEVV